jgi:hypothetical protein
LSIFLLKPMQNSSVVNQIMFLPSCIQGSFYKKW